MLIEITYPARCKHCINLAKEKNERNKYQSFCNVKKEFTTLKEAACKDFKL